MLIIPEPQLRQVMSSLVSIVRCARTHNGTQSQIGTIDEKTLRTAALVALMVVSGQPVDTVAPN